MGNSSIGLSSPDDSDISLANRWMSTECEGLSGPRCPGWPAGRGHLAALPPLLIGLSPCRCRLRNAALSSGVADQGGRWARPGMSLSHWLEMLAAHATVAARRPGKTCSGSSAGCASAHPRVSGLGSPSSLDGRPMACWSLCVDKLSCKQINSWAKMLPRTGTDMALPQMRRPVTSSNGSCPRMAGKPCRDARS